MNAEPVILGIGHTALDHLLRVDRFPGKNGKLDAVAAMTQGGGPVATACVTLARLGMSHVGFHGIIGDDPAGKRIIRELNEWHVGTDTMHREPNIATPEAYIIIETGSTSRSVILNRTGCREMTPKDLDSLDLEHVDYLLLDGRDSEAAVVAARKVRTHGGRVMLDLGSIRKQTEDLISNCDYCVVSRDFIMDYLEGEELITATRTLLSMGPELAVITMGAGGAVFADAEGSGWSAPHAVQAVDTTGAGDVFHGALLYALINNMRRNDALHFAAIAAGLKCRLPGGRTGIPTLEMIRKIMKEEAL